MYLGCTALCIFTIQKESSFGNRRLYSEIWFTKVNGSNCDPRIKVCRLLVVMGWLVKLKITLFYTTIVNVTNFSPIKLINQQLFLITYKTIILMIETIRFFWEEMSYKNVSSWYQFSAIKHGTNKNLFKIMERWKGYWIQIFHDILHSFSWQSKILPYHYLYFNYNYHLHYIPFIAPVTMKSNKRTNLW